LEQWLTADAAYEELLVARGLDEHSTTTELVLAAMPIETDQQFVAEIKAETLISQQQWVYYTLHGETHRYGIAFPIAGSVSPRTLPTALYVEIHSRLVAWWLTYAWRSRQLARAAADLSDAAQIVPAACCARALLETAAAFWVDARRIADIWRTAKADGAPTLEKKSLRVRLQFIERLNEAQFGGKFDDKVPELAEAFGRRPRANVLGAVEKLDKASSGHLYADYQWLCNTAHPSLGTALVFSAAPLTHLTRTHGLRILAESPIWIDFEPGFDDVAYVTESIPSAVARCAVAALEVLTEVLDAALRVIDDIGLTTDAPAMADFDYWRPLRPTGRNTLCACGSGEKTKHCIHEWRGTSPTVPERFVAPA
jgi:hypothetical protein